MNFEVNAVALPDRVQAHLQSGYEPEPSKRLVHPLDDGSQESIKEMNIWLRGEEAPYPDILGPVIWFGTDGVGNFLGWDPVRELALLWNPADEEPWEAGTVDAIWRFVLNGYRHDSDSTDPVSA